MKGWIKSEWGRAKGWQADENLRRYELSRGAAKRRDTTNSKQISRTQTSNESERRQPTKEK